MHALEGKRAEECGGVFAMNGDDTVEASAEEASMREVDGLRRSCAIAQRRKVAYTPTMHVRSLQSISHGPRWRG